MDIEALTPRQKETFFNWFEDKGLLSKLEIESYYDDNGTLSIGLQDDLDRLLEDEIIEVEKGLNFLRCLWMYIKIHQVDIKYEKWREKS